MAEPQPQITSQNWQGHWHGYGPWVGAARKYFLEGNRRPPHPDVPSAEAKHQGRYFEAAGEFKTSNLPPIVLGHWLLKKSQAARNRVWTDVDDVVDWLSKEYSANPPLVRTDGNQAYESLESKAAYALDSLPRGVDLSWVHYAPGQRIVALHVVCCPNLHQPTLSCPLPPG